MKRLLLIALLVPCTLLAQKKLSINEIYDPANKNAQFVVQPYYLPANVLRFSAPAGPLVHTIAWERGRARFRTVRQRDGTLVAAQEFTSGVPEAGSEAVHLALYAFGPPDASRPLDDEVVIERFEHVP